MYVGNTLNNDKGAENPATSYCALFLIVSISFLRSTAHFTLQRDSVFLRFLGIFHRPEERLHFLTSCLRRGDLNEDGFGSRRGIFQLIPLSC